MDYERNRQYNIVGSSNAPFIPTLFIHMEERKSEIIEFIVLIEEASK